MTSIKLKIEFSSLGETTEAEAKEFAAAVQQRIESEYPEASVSVGVDILGPGELHVSAESCELQDEIIERVKRIEQDTWEDGTW